MKMNIFEDIERTIKIYSSKLLPEGSSHHLSIIMEAEVKKQIQKNITKQTTKANLNNPPFRSIYSLKI